MLYNKTYLAGPSKVLSTLPNKRTQRGVLSFVLFSILILIAFGIATFGSDVAHNISVRTALQSACDAAAIAGARDYVSPNLPDQADQDAYAIAASNSADGHPVSQTDPNTQIQATSSPTVTGGECQVTAQVTIKNYFAQLFGHGTDVIDVTSTANAYDAATGVWPNSLFPLAVSIDTLNGHTVPLYQSKIGDTVTFYIESQNYINAAFTSFTTGSANASYVNSAIQQMLGLAPVQNGFVPAVSVGDSLSIMNGDASTKSLASSTYASALTDGRTLYVPVFSGNGPYNGSVTCLGFIGIQVNQVIVNQAGGKTEELVCTLVKGLVKGNPGTVNGSSSGAINTGIQNLSAGLVELTD